MSHLSVYESDFGPYYIGPRLEDFLLQARRISLPAWMPWFAQRWLWPADCKILEKAWDFVDQMEAIALRRWYANEATLLVFEIGSKGRLVAKDPQDLE